MDVSKINPDGTTYYCKDATARQALIYSTEETNTNKVWIDGKQIYRKVFTNETTATSGTAQYDLLPDVSDVNYVNIQVVLYKYTDINRTILYQTFTGGSGYTQLSSSVSVYRSGNNTLRIYYNFNNGDISTCPYFRTIVITEYTKTE